MKTKTCSVRWVVPILIVSILVVGALNARGDDTNSPVVSSVVSDSPDHSNEAGLGNRLIVTVSNLSNLLTQESQEHHKIILYLDGMALKGLYPESKDLLRNELRFQLQRTDSTRQTWAALLGRPTHFLKKVTVSVGLEDKYPVATNVQGQDRLDLVVIREGWFLTCALVLVLIAIWLYFWGRKSQMLRDAGPDPGEGRLRPYSLAKTQMALWFFLILVSFLIIWLITGAHDTITDSVLVLMGIGTGTALGVVVQDKSKEGKSQVLESLKGLKQQEAALKNQHADENAIKIVTDRIRELTPASEHFLTDILTDADGISFHRFQIAVWTLVLSLVFIKEVYFNLSMPDFNATLLALMGISSGTYVGFMIPEGHSTDQ